MDLSNIFKRIGIHFMQLRNLTFSKTKRSAVHYLYLYAELAVHILFLHKDFDGQVQSYES